MLKKIAWHFSLIATILLISGAVNAATISVLPAGQNVLQGANIPIAISGSEFSSGTMGGGLTINWNPSVLQFVSISTNPFPGDKFFGSTDTTTASSGSLNFSVGSFFTGATGPSFDIATLAFTAIGLGSSLIDLGFKLGDVWVDSDFNELSPQPTLIDGSVQVNAVPIPAAVWLLGSGVVGLVALTRRKKV
jgi:hypothetical protein